jgi:hypothetical protein
MMGRASALTPLSPSNNADVKIAWVDDNPDDNPGSIRYHLMGQDGMRRRRRANKINHLGTR